jgi:adenosylcobyric acid synthase
MICGATSDAGKSTLAVGLCRLLARQGVRVAPFKAQNMSLNSTVSAAGGEIARAQATQAAAAGVAAEVAMNPILLKPTGERSCQVVVLGRPWAHLDAAAYHDAKPELLAVVLDALADLRGRFDVLVCEGAGSPAEINLLDHDIVNLRVAKEAGLPAVVVADIDPGGVWAALYGTVALLPDDLRPLVKGFVINKLRGDPALLGSAPAELERLTGVPTLGVLPHLSGIGLDAEDSLALRGPRPPAGPDPGLDVAAVRLPRIANFTDLDPLALEPGVSLRLVDRPRQLGDPDLVVLPGTKATVADLEWLRACGLADAIAGSDALVLGICGGFQMMGRSISDRVEAGLPGPVDGLGWLPVDTEFQSDKVTRRRQGSALGHAVAGYEIHHGRTAAANPWLVLDDEPEGAAAGRCLGTSLHGLFEEDGFRGAFLQLVAARRGRPFTPSAVSFAAAREAQIDRIADMVGAHLDMPRIEALLRLRVLSAG